MYAGIAIGSCQKDISFGGKVGYNQTNSEGRLALIDIDGNGLPDKVFKKSGMSFRENDSGPDGGTTFGPRRSVHGMPEISKEKTQMVSGGGEAYVGAGFSAWVGVNGSGTFGESPVYISDVNGDGSCQ